MKTHPLGHPDTQSDNAPALVEFICALEIVTHEQQHLNRLETSRPKDLGEQDRLAREKNRRAEVRALSGGRSTNSHP